jgi:hypothetical protein
MSHEASIRKEVRKGSFDYERGEKMKLRLEKKPEKKHNY